MAEPERPSLTLPDELTRRARALIKGAGKWVSSDARDAATVALLRDSAGRVEVFLQRRAGSMAFAAGMHVFPGGRVEESDADPAVPWRGDAVREPFALALEAKDTARFRALTVAGSRETWEEAGVVLACDASGAVSRRPGEPGEDFIAWILAQRLEVDGDMFQPWLHWVTPEVESRRFDTRFVVVALPEGQDAVDRGMESQGSSWITPGAAIDGLRAGTLPMLPPTADALDQLGQFDSVAAIMADATTRSPRPILPRPVAGPGEEVHWRLVDAYTSQVIAEP